MTLVLTVTSAWAGAQEQAGVVAPGAALVKVDGDFQFAEGPTADAQGAVYFSDVRASRTYKWSPGGRLALFREDTGSSNGLALDKAGNLLACEGDRGRVVSIDPQGKVSVVADQYHGKRFNQPNDLWIDPKGGVYISDPIYGRAEKWQDGEHVYYVSSDRRSVIRVIADMVRPNGLAGTADGKTLYVTDHGAGQTWVYDIAPDGTLSHKRLFASVGADGMKVDMLGNVYMAQNGILVYDPTGRHLQTIAVPEQPTNLCFAGQDGRTLFITARTAVYTIALAMPNGSVTNLHASRLPDTGQTQKYTNTFGEDADYSINPPSFTDNGDGTVTDNVTELVWQQVDGGEMTWENALAYAKKLNLAGHADWRLPTSQELFSIVDHSALNPALDTRVFPPSGAEYWWSSTPRADDPSRVWVVNAGGGIGAHQKRESRSAGGNRAIHVRCVRSSVSNLPQDLKNRFVDHGDGTVTDTVTGLDWQQAEVESAMTWEEALAYAEGLLLAGQTDWRLPSIKELRSLSDDGFVRPSIDRHCFPGMRSSPYWSSTSQVNRPTRAWYVDFDSGLVTYAEKSVGQCVRCVRGGAIEPLAAGPPARSAPPASPPPDRSGRGERRLENPLVRALDANQDGVLSADEIARSTAALGKLDVNGDGRISRDEMRPEGDVRRR